MAGRGGTQGKSGDEVVERGGERDAGGGGMEGWKRKGKRSPDSSLRHVFPTPSAFPLFLHMAGSEYGRTARDVLVACLALWSVTSLVVIAVWRTSPGVRSMERCKAELHRARGRLEEARAEWGRRREELQDLLRKSAQNQTHLRRQADQLTQSLRNSDASVSRCLQGRLTYSISRYLVF
ncbi:hypothetical protein JZ751_013810 [Albula glossodonta]|uniref:Uncharacterized protein n=1 Tax=Albula glossodonta TaxID=121402 RepID=A0A8T2NWG4_9TELE|nr:hypothetical protein JZ751_013810 [Albula glossodonta]